MTKTPIDKATTEKTNSRHVWYAAYGSNINYQRFMRYINKCTDTAAPMDAKALTIPYDIYFAAKSLIWNGGGVAFLDDTKPGMALGRMYRITAEQFAEVQAQEGVKYTRKLLLGYKENVPIYTFTAPQKREDINVPDAEYLATILNGLKETYPEMEEDEFLRYLCERGNTDAESLEKR